MLQEINFTTALANTTTQVNEYALSQIFGLDLKSHHMFVQEKICGL